MEAFETFITNVTDFVWGGTWGDKTILPVGPVVVLLLGAGLYFMVKLKFRPLKRFIPALAEVWAGRKGDGDKSKITAWQALSTALSGQVGTGNLADPALFSGCGLRRSLAWRWRLRKAHWPSNIEKLTNTAA